MKLITAIIQPHRMEDVCEILMDHGIDDVTVTEVRHCGSDATHTEVYRGSSMPVEARPKLKLEILAQSEETTPLVDALVKTSRTGRAGDGRVFVVDVGTGAPAGVADDPGLAVGQGA